MISKDELKAAYDAGFKAGQGIEPDWRDDSNGFDEWYQREIAYPPEKWDDHHDD